MSTPYRTGAEQSYLKRFFADPLSRVWILVTVVAIAMIVVSVISDEEMLQWAAAILLFVPIAGALVVDARINAPAIQEHAEIE